MKMRCPSIPLIAIDPYFSVWSHDKINTHFSEHWTGSRNAILGTVTIDGAVYRFLGESNDPEIQQKSVELDALSTKFIFFNDKIELTAVFTSPVMATDLYYVSRPVSYLKLSYDSVDGKEHEVCAKISVSEELVLNMAGEGRACSEQVNIKNGTAVRMGNGNQNVLWRSGDNVRIDWGYFYLAVNGEAKVGNEVFRDLYAVYAETELNPSAVFALAYDDIYSLVYFGEKVKAYWKSTGKTINDVIGEALGEYDELYQKCCDFSSKLHSDAVKKGGEKYAELLDLSYRQVMAAHKLVTDSDGNNIYISKECFSNGCAATVDVSYPSAPMYLYYNTELLKGMLRPILRYANSEEWKFDFAPHDVGCYPIVNGQVYFGNNIEFQMPLEECGNMIILISALCKIEKSYDFAEENMDLLEKWNKYLVQYGCDPQNQLCTDDFAGHLSHNCNLSIKSIMGMVGFADICDHLWRNGEAKEQMQKARKYVESVLERAKNADGSTRLAFDMPGSYSLKYNAVWDKVWKTNLFPNTFCNNEVKCYKREALPYGVPLDSREKYTKSDWMLWAGCLSETQQDFELFTNLLWDAYNTMRSRVPMTDWYFADTSEMSGFRHRSVQGALFIKLIL